MYHIHTKIRWRDDHIAHIINKGVVFGDEFFDQAATKHKIKSKHRD